MLNTALGVLLLAGAGWGYLLVSRSNAPAAAAPTGSRTVDVSQGAVVETVSASGTVNSAVIASADFATAGTVSSISVHVGDTVTKGQVLAKVDPTDAQAQASTANANLTAAKASLTRANSSGDDATVAQAQAQVTTAQAALDAANRSLQGTTLTAPMAGTVTAVTGSVGGSSSGSSSSSASSSSSSGSGAASTGSSSSGFIQLADLASTQVSASFAEADATKLKAGQVATVTWAALTGTTATGKVTTIAPTASTSNNVNSYAVVVSLDTVPTGVRIGQTVTAKVTVAEANDAVRVPNAAVRTAGTRHTVTVQANGVPEVRTVEIGVEGDTFIQITSGLTVGEKVTIVTATTATTGTNGGAGFGGGLGGGGLGGAGGAGGAGAGAGQGTR
jgi:membrane fusion protein, macrolide-specific efflux system